MSKLLKNALLFLVNRSDNKLYNCHQTQYNMRKNLDVDYKVGELLNVTAQKLVCWKESIFLDCVDIASSSFFIKSFPKHNIWRAYD